MRLKSPNQAPEIALHDVYGNTVTIGGPSPRRTLLCFFRDPACPFCNFRVYQLTSIHEQLARHGLDIIAVFSATPDEVKRFAAHKPRPFPVIADADGETYALYGIEHSPWGKWKGILTRIPTLLKGLRIVGLAGLKTSNLMPADFLIDENGRIIETWYGRDAGDRIPLERIELFAARGTPSEPVGRSAAA